MSTKTDSRSGNPAKRAAAKKAAAKKTTPRKAAPPARASSASDFKKRAEGVLIQLPSGLVARMKRVDLQMLVLQGNVHNPLMEIVGEALEKGKKADIASMVGVEDDKLDLDTINDMFEMVNHIVTECMVDPKVYPEPTVEELEAYNEENSDDPLDDPIQLREPELLYVNEIDAEDKMFIFQWSIGGTTDVAQFREEAGASLDAVAKSEGGGAKAK